jgi:hypothetical protein
VGCADDSGCASDLAGTMNVERVLTSEVTQLEHTTLLVVRLIDAQQGRVLARVNASLTDATQAQLLDAMRRLTHEALTGQRLDTTGALRLAVEEAGAMVSLDGQSLGTAPLAEPVVRVPEGPHELMVQKEGFVRWSSVVAVRAGGESLVQVRLIPMAALVEGSRSRAWTFGYVSAGVAAASLIAASIFGGMARSNYGNYQAAMVRSDSLELRDRVSSQALTANVFFGVAAVAAAASVALLVAGIVSDASARPHAEVVPAAAAGPASQPLTPAR